MPGITPLERAMAAAVLAGGITFAYLTTEAKQYTSEILCSVVLMALVQSIPRTCPGQLSRLGLLLVLMLSASTFPLAAFAVGSVFLLDGVRRRGSLDRIYENVKSGGWIFVAAGAIYIVYYVLHIRSAYEALLLNFGYTYQGFGFVRDSNYLAWLAATLWSILTSHYGILALANVVLAGVAIVGFKGRDLPYARQAGALLGICVALNVAGIYPLLPARFSAFALPWLAVLAGVGAAYLIARVRDHGMRSIAAAGASALVMIPSGVYIAQPVTHQARRSIETLQSQPGTAVMVTVGSQPVFDLYLRRSRALFGGRCHASGIAGYTNRCRALKMPGDGVFIGADTKWYLLNYAAIIGRGVEPVGFPGPSPQAFAGHYLDWLIGEIPAGKDVLLFSAPHIPRDTDGDPLQTRLASLANVDKLIDERNTPTATRAGQVYRIRRR